MTVTQFPLLFRFRVSGLISTVRLVVLTVNRTDAFPSRLNVLFAQEWRWKSPTNRVESESMPV